MGRTACTEPQCLYRGALYLNSRAIPLLPLWALRPVQSPSACTRVHFTLQKSYTSTPPTGRTACTEPQCLYKGALDLTEPLSRYSSTRPLPHIVEQGSVSRRPYPVSSAILSHVFPFLNRQYCARIKDSLRTAQ
jgi:hypothetical protein